MAKPLTSVQNFYKATLSIACGAGAGKIYVSILPSVSVGYLVFSPSNTSLREIIWYDSTGTDGNGTYVNVPSAGDRGLGGTVAQAHEAQESIRMNIVGTNWDDMIAEVLTNIPAAIAAVAASVAAKAGLALNNIFTGINTFINSTVFTVSPTVPTPVNSGDAVNMAYVLSLVLGGTVVGFNAMTVNYDAFGRVKNVRDNQLGKTYIISYDSGDNPTKIFDGTSTWRINYSGDRVASITKTN